MLLISEIYKMSQLGKRVRSEQLEDVKRKVVDNGCTLPLFYGDLVMDEVSSTQMNKNKQKSLLLGDGNLEELSQAYFNDNVEVNDTIRGDDETDEGSVYRSLNDVPLLSQSVYFLNKSNSKWVCVGLDHNLYFEPTIKIVGLKKQSITMNMEEWKKFVAHKLRIMSCFKKDNQLFSTFKIGDMKISYECFDGINKVLRMDKNGECLYISQEGLLELWQLIELINIRIENLFNLNYGRYYKNIIESLSMMVGDVRSNMGNLIVGPPSESACITKELMVYAIKKIAFDLQFYKATIAQY